MEEHPHKIQDSLSDGRNTPAGPVGQAGSALRGGPKLAQAANISRRPARRKVIQESTGFLTLFWSIVIALAVYIVFTASGRPMTYTLAGATIALVALLPGWLWCSGRAKGLPIYPIYAATFVTTCALQLFSSYDRLSEDSDGATIWRASLTIAGFLVATTIVWMLWLSRPRRLPTQCRALQGQKGTAVLLAVLAISAAFTLVDHAGWIGAIAGQAATALRQFLRGLTGFAVFILSMRWGARALTIPQRAWLILLLAAFCAIDAASLFLVTAITTSLMMLAGFAVGRKAIPWGKAGLVVSIFGFLHLGKGQMRADHWGVDLAERPLIKPWEIPGIYAEWIEDSTTAMLLEEEKDVQKNSILSRSSTIQLLLQAQRMADELPFLNGETYALIPDALVPRLLHPSKTSPHDSTTILNIHYGNQSLEAAQVTSIGWGMLNESFANFGFKGCFYLALVLGSFYGLITRWSIGLPLTSVPALVGVFTVSFAVETEMTAAIFITAYAQGLFALMTLAWFFAERQPLHDDAAIPAAIQAKLSSRPTWSPQPARRLPGGPRALPWWNEQRREKQELPQETPLSSPSPAPRAET